MVSTSIEGFPVLDNALSLYEFEQSDPIGESNNKVFEATRRIDKKKFALKQCTYTHKEEKKHNEEKFNKIKNEILLLESIKHENIVEIYDKFIVLGNHSNSIYFTMDLAKSKNSKLSNNFRRLKSKNR